MSTVLVRGFELLASRTKQVEKEKEIAKKRMTMILEKQNVPGELMEGTALHLMMTQVLCRQICISVGSKTCFRRFSKDF